MSTREQAKGFLKGLEEIGATPEAGDYNKIIDEVKLIAREDGTKISEGGNPDKIYGISAERLKLQREKVQKINNQLAHIAAGEFSAIQQRLEDDYKFNPDKKLADMHDAQIRLEAMGKHGVTSWADEVMEGKKYPKSEYEILTALKTLPKSHPMRNEHAKNGDCFATWTEAGKTAHADMVYFGTLGDKIPYKAEDGSRIAVDVSSIYSPPSFTPAEIVKNKYSAE